MHDTVNGVLVQRPLARVTAIVLGRQTPHPARYFFLDTIYTLK
jgi:hypothetical protein